MNYVNNVKMGPKTGPFLGSRKLVVQPDLGRKTDIPRALIRSLAMAEGVASLNAINEAKKAAEQIGQLNPDKAPQELVALLKSSYASLRLSAKKALLEIKDPNTTQPLINSFDKTAERKDWHEEDISLPVKTLMRVGRINEEAFQLIIKNILDEKSSRTVRLGLAQVLGGIGDKRAEGALKMVAQSAQYADVCAAALEALADLKVGTVRFFTEFLKDESTKIKRQAARGIAWLKPQVAPPELVALLSHPDVVLRLMVKDALQVIKNPMDAQALIDSLDKVEDWRPGDTSIPVKTLAEMCKRDQGGKVFALIIKNINDNKKSVYIREGLVKVLAKIRDRDAIGGLKELALNDKVDANIRGVAVEALAELKIVNANFFIELLKDLNIWIKIKAAERISRSELEKVPPELVALLKHPDGDLRAVVLETLWKIKDPDSAQPLIDAIEVINGWYGEGNSFLKQILVAMGQRNPKVLALICENALDIKKEWVIRESLAEILGEIGAKKAAATLQQIIKKDWNSFVRAAAEKSLENLENDDAII